MFKNVFVYDNAYLSMLIRYIEQNPVKAGIVKRVGLYKWSSSYCLLQNSYDSILSDSVLKNKEFFNLLKNELTNGDMNKLQELEKTKYKKDKALIRLRQNSLEFYFNNVKDISLRNKKIKEAVLDGYKQSEIADFLGVFRTTVSKAMAKYK